MGGVNHPKLEQQGGAVDKATQPLNRAVIALVLLLWTPSQHKPNQDLKLFVLDIYWNKHMGLNKQDMHTSLQTKPPN